MLGFYLGTCLIYGLFLAALSAALWILVAHYCSTRYQIPLRYLEKYSELFDSTTKGFATYTSFSWVRDVEHNLFFQHYALTVYYTIVFGLYLFCTTYLIQNILDTAFNQGNVFWFIISLALIGVTGVSMYGAVKRGWRVKQVYDMYRDEEAELEYDGA